jgi:hypothetical protein
MSAKQLAEQIEEAMADYWASLGELMPDALAEAIDALGGIGSSDDLMQCFMSAVRSATTEYSAATGINVDLEMIGDDGEVRQQ